MTRKRNELAFGTFEKAITTVRQKEKEITKSNGLLKPTGKV